MADEEATDGEGGEGAPKKKLAGKKLILIALIALILLGGGGGAAWFFLFKKKPAEHAEEAAKPAQPKILAFLDLPDILVNLQSTGRTQSFLKLKVALEYDQADTLVQLNQKMPRVIDNFQVYLREMRSEDLAGSAGLQRLKEELLYRVNAAIAPAKISDVLFKEMLVQ
ncbi:MAG: flagellar basal body-associated FliL family protein [Alphaproteobacteria bacterium]|jgi:flagellar FliL protein|nr:flagellar basal body-associated FliL family protein [Alphaproteobacteria bacterium]